MDTDTLLISSNNSDGSSSAGSFSMLLLLVAFVLVSSHSISHRLPFLTEGSLALLWGLFAGGGFFFYFERIKGVHIPVKLVNFNYDIYMSLLLPPIIFYAGFSIKKKHFFSNIGTLATLGVAGTILLAAVLAIILATALHRVGLDTHNIVGNALALGVIFSSTDSVAALQALDGSVFPQLHALVFGEAVVNDATAIVLLKAVQNIRTEAQLTLGALGFIVKSFIQLSLLSMILGVTVGLICAYTLKHYFGHGRHSTDHEVSLLAALGFLSYLLAEYFNLSGVFSTFFCGLTMSHYAWHSLSPSAKVASVHAFRVLSFLAELLMFLSCGLDLWENKLWHKDILTKKRSMQKIASLVCWISLSVPVARFVVALPLLSAGNALRKPENRVSWTNRVAISWAGCARGAVTLALAVNHFLGSGEATKLQESEENRIIAAAAMVVIVLSTIFLGGASPAVFARLLCGSTTTAHSTSRSSTGAVAGSKIGYHETHTLPTSNNENSIRAPLLATAATPPAATAQRILSPRNNHSHGGDSTTRNNNNNDSIENDILGSSIHAKWTSLDRRVFQPLFGGRSMSFRVCDEGENGVGDGGGGGGDGPGGGTVVTSPFESTSIQRTQGQGEEGQGRRQARLAAAAGSDLETGVAPQHPAPPISKRIQKAGSNLSFGRVENDLLEELFTQPGRSRRGEEVDRRLKWMVCSM